MINRNNGFVLSDEIYRYDESIASNNWRCVCVHSLSNMPRVKIPFVILSVQLAIAFCWLYYPVKMPTISNHAEREDGASTQAATNMTPAITQLHAIPIAIASRWRRGLFYICCKTDAMEYKNYVSFLSAVRSVQPGAVLFAHESYPGDKPMDLWVSDIEASVPFLLKQNISEDDALCPRRSATDIRRFLAKHDFQDSLYVGTLTVLRHPFQPRDDGSTIMDYYNATTQQGIIYVPAGDDPNTQSVPTGTCPAARPSDASIPDVCFTLLDPAVKNMPELPEYVMSASSALAAQLRLVLYGSSAPAVLQPQPRHPVPNVAHYIWLGGGHMTFTFFMSVLSAVYVGHVERVYIHGDAAPGGEHWRHLQEMDGGERVHYVPWHRPRGIFGRPVNAIRNQADTVKSLIMHTWGGIMMDPDVMFLRRPEPWMFHYDALMTGRAHKPMINPAISFSRPKSLYSQLWLQSEKQFVNGRYVWDCCYKMYNVWIRNPLAAKLERDFNLLCRNGSCFRRSNELFYVNDTKDERNSLNHWKDKVITAHFSSPDPFKSQKTCAFTLRGFAGEAGRLILRAAGLLAAGQGIEP